VTPDPTRSHEPRHDMTRLAEEMLEVIPVISRDRVKAIVLLTDEATAMNGIALSGWEDDAEAVAHMFIHLRMIMRASGKDLIVMTEDNSPASR